MVFRDTPIQFYLFVSLLVIAPIFAQNEHAKWFKDDEVNTLNTTDHFGNRKTVNRTSTSPHFPHTTRHEWRTPNITTHLFGNRRTVNDTSTSPYFPQRPTYEVSPNTTTHHHFGNRRTVNRTSTSPCFSQRPTYEVSPNTTTHHHFGNRRTVNRTRIPSPTNTPTYNRIDEMAEQLAVSLEYFGKYITSNGSSKKDYKNVLFVGVCILEVITMSTGKHFVIPPTEDKQLEEKQQEIVWAVFQLWLDLSCTVDVDAILDNVTIGETVIQYNSTAGKLQAVNKLQEILSTLLNKLNDTIEENDFLSSKYEAERIRYLAQHFHEADTQLKVYVPLDDAMRGAVDRGALKAWLNDLNIRKFFIHGYVLQMRKQNALQGSNEDDENRVWARTILKVAKEECCTSQMQNLYAAALNETVKIFDVAAPRQRVLRFLVQKVNKSIKVDSLLKNEWTKQENEVREELREEEEQRLG